MLVQTRYFSFVLEALPNETTTDFTALCLLVRQVLDEHPEKIYELDAVVDEARRYVGFHEKDCEVDVGYTLFG